MINTFFKMPNLLIIKTLPTSCVYHSMWSEWRHFRVYFSPGWNLHFLICLIPHYYLQHFWGLFSFVFRNFCVGCCFVPSWTDSNTTRGLWLTPSHIQASIFGSYSGPARHYGAPEKMLDRKKTPLFTSCRLFIFKPVVDFKQFTFLTRSWLGWYEMSQAGS